ncbi:hypothetical protein HDK77DRAFT_478239 [Phyllosticta capitalensis]
MNSTFIPPFAAPGNQNLSTESIIAIVGAILTVAVPLCGFVFKRVLFNRSNAEDLEQGKCPVPPKTVLSLTSKELGTPTPTLASIGRRRSTTF